MPWLRIGDETLTHPMMFKLLRACGGNIALRNEAYGALVLMASVSAQQCTDYVVDPGLVAMIAPGRFPEIMDVLETAGLVSKITDEDGYEMWKITDIDELLHMRLKAEVDIDRRRKNDGRRPDLMIPVKIRDGDQCRWCGKSVKWGDQKSGRGATIDSLNGHVDSTVDTLVVSCRTCNSKRGRGEELTLRPAPETPWYTEKTAEFINASSWARDNGVRIAASQTRLPIPGVIKRAAGASAAPAAGFDDPLDDAPDWVTGPIATPRAAAPDVPASTEPTATAISTDHDPTNLPTSEEHTDENDASTCDNAAISLGEKIEPELSRDSTPKGDGSGFAGTGREGYIPLPLERRKDRRINKGGSLKSWRFWARTGEGKQNDR
ncbi:hypothetical protein H7347_06915 [Corynebacterium sp. zg-331]|uniref:HNH endonuclease n=1 Tax=unclassified Corynebacterium TaxID=2624378 RepID=UPI00128B965D|nr:MULTISPECIES: hypothetical protein [unclassified Corynebacterium]MBC3186303.1 hypothetical protein [Corynebacterium sp. zg-331]MPV52792.1 hypothetical protein [Corynebacterium sp. zg331]